MTLVYPVMVYQISSTPHKETPFPKTQPRFKTTFFVLIYSFICKDTDEHDDDDDDDTTDDENENFYVFLLSYGNTIINQSACVFSLSFFLNIRLS